MPVIINPIAKITIYQFLIIKSNINDNTFIPNGIDIFPPFDEKISSISRTAEGTGGGKNRRRQ